MNTNEYVTYEVLNKALSELQEYMNLKHERDRRLNSLKIIGELKRAFWYAGVVLTGIETAVLASWLFTALNAGDTEGLSLAACCLFWSAAAFVAAYVIARDTEDRMEDSFVAWTRVYLKGTDLWVDSDTKENKVDPEAKK